jgi:hypothetical protein
LQYQFQYHCHYHYHYHYPPSILYRICICIRIRIRISNSNSKCKGGSSRPWKIEPATGQILAKVQRLQQQIGNHEDSLPQETATALATSRGGESEAMQAQMQEGAVRSTASNNHFFKWPIRILLWLTRPILSPLVLKIRRAFLN